MSEPLYSIDILRLATCAATFPRLDRPAVTVDRRSSTCGGRITVDMRLDTHGRVAAYGHEVRACALGQAAATLLARHILGLGSNELSSASDDLARWLARADAAQPEWPGVELLERARAYPARHGAVRLAFEAAAEAAVRAAA